MNESIVAIATAYGAGSIAIVRLSGEAALKIALKLTKKNKLKPRYAHLCEIFDEKNEFIDEAIVLYFKAPHSFTGEDIVEFQLHGGFVLAQTLLEACVKFGARLARAGEFSKRACLNGKMSPLKALAINDLINAKSQKAAKIIAQNLQGKFGELLNKIRTDLVKTLAFVETSIDYADDDLPVDLLEKTRGLYKENARILREIVQISRSKKGLVEGFKIAIIGKANVGKSSLLNALLSFERAIVSEIEGTTRDRVEESLKIGTHLVKIIDTAGIRASEDKIEQIGVNLSLQALAEADFIVALFDSSRPLDSEDEHILKMLESCDKKIFFVLNKMDLKSEFFLQNAKLSSENFVRETDLFSKFAKQKRSLSSENHTKEFNLFSKFKALQDIKFIKISAKNDISPLKIAIESHLNSLDSEGFIITNLALINSCERASEMMQRASELLNESTLELFAFECNEAIKEIEKWTHSFDRDEILDEMFGNFCLGK
ncbi:tRNA uridine-5-carboxymethylaminomethyl(34) synthesis GTPase MnmE [Campylobacter troglodytis]|uniref:tRNA uridine-5-carboxymethylaminomethyl(34) synthesis GTPase MnmE n=1 Tax=Campylobacter troglodytis TaxID=654363 RepID=UPI001159E14C|nr:tRNA uridine-5-carboxymethylaminomethyl(34) synthesis GTPase MnmE [Campylobacter troglodytis]TQR60842.1 tRNA uridine-5-carboxymethylaminomethyl(34) synthesis GTPase MnmE [Campylobacter troglodytis]